MRSRRGALVAVSSVVLLGAVVLAGRWESQRATRIEQHGIERVFAAASAEPVPDGYRIDARFRCLLYKRGVHPFAYELCFDPSGRLVEAIVRLSGEPVVSTLRSQPQDATIRARSSAIDDVLRQMRAFRPGASRFIAVRYPAYDPTVRHRPPPPRVPRGSGLPSARP